MLCCQHSTDGMAKVELRPRPSVASYHPSLLAGLASSYFRAPTTLAHLWPTWPLLPTRKRPLLPSGALNFPLITLVQL